MVKVKTVFATIAAACALVGCSRDADLVSQNISTAADQFEIMRRIVFYNGITGEYILSIEGQYALRPITNRESYQ